jgi:hypothetical protein
MKLDRVGSKRAERDTVVHEAGFVVGERGKARLEARRAHSERLQFGFHLAAEIGRSSFANRGQFICMRGELVERGGHCGFDLRFRLANSFELANLGARSLQRFERRVD